MSTRPRSAATEGHGRRAAAARALGIALVACLAACGDDGTAAAPDPPADAPTPDDDGARSAADGVEAGEAGEAGEAAGAAQAMDEEHEAALERMRALGYAGTAEALPEGARFGVLHYDRDRAASGLTLLTNSSTCSAQLMDMEGEIVHEWRTEPCFVWGNVCLAPNGDLLVVGRIPYDKDDAAAGKAARYVMRLSWGGDVLWKRQMLAHHDIEIRPDGKLVTLTYDHVVHEDAHSETPVRDNFIVVMSPEGEVLESASIYEILRDEPDLHALYVRRAREFDGVRELDVLHVNAVEFMHRPELVERDPFYSPSNVLLCSRHQDAVFVIDWDRKELVWSWGQDELSGPHDAQVLPGGNVLIFDNGLDRGYSRVVEVDPLTDEIVWEYKDPDLVEFFTRTRGSSQRLSNGNTLIVDSDNGRAFEVTPLGAVVWSFLNSNMTADREPITIVRMRRYEGITYEAMLERVAASRVPRTD